MIYRKIQADLFFDGDQFLPEKTVVVLNDLNQIINILQPEDMEYTNDAEHISGIVVPGLINAHCHLELSWMRNKIESGKGLTSFIQQISDLRQEESQEIAEHEAIEEDSRLFNKGISAVGDICNTTISIKAKTKSRIYYHSFIEVFGTRNSDADQRFTNAYKILQSFKKIYDEIDSPCSITPHATYSVSEKLFRLIKESNYTCGKSQSIHTHESQEEINYFLQSKSDLQNFFHSRNILPDFASYKGHRPLMWALTQMSKCNRIILVHNTYCNENDIQSAISYSNLLSWCICPKANIFIENKLPPIELFMDKNLPLILGTDSLASNDSLDLVNELIVVQKVYPKIPLAEMLRWVTRNGAIALGIDKTFGRIKIGMKPGLTCIYKADNLNLTLQKDSYSKRIC